MLKITKRNRKTIEGVYVQHWIANRMPLHPDSNLTYEMNRAYLIDQKLYDVSRLTLEELSKEVAEYMEVCQAEGTLDIVTRSTGYRTQETLERPYMECA